MSDCPVVSVSSLLNFGTARESGIGCDRECGRSSAPWARFSSLREGSDELDEPDEPDEPPERVDAEPKLDEPAARLLPVDRAPDLEPNVEPMPDTEASQGPVTEDAEGQGR